jgi:DNA-binding transcriptional MerR regulator
MDTSLSIADAAKQSGLTAHTLRYYEQIGLIGRIDRRGGARRYSAEDMRWLDFLVKLRATGMPVREMQRYARLRRLGDGPANLAERQKILERHAEKVENEIRVLSETLDFIHGKLRLYHRLTAPKRRA